tara:strand:+ start:12446 stop:12652 length:207 start_codon:yes stop_codon:yes gene_type:complete
MWSGPAVQLVSDFDRHKLGVRLQDLNEQIENICYAGDMKIEVHTSNPLDDRPQLTMAVTTVDNDESAV